jgi:hypothetical protein
VLESDRLRYEVRPGAARVLATRSEAATLRAIGSQAPQTI